MEELAAFIVSNPDPRELKRALAVSMTLQGYTHEEIMAILQVCSGFISKWKQAFMLRGVEGLKLAYQGTKGYLTAEQKQRVRSWLKHKNYWNLNELERYIMEQFDVMFAAKSSYYDLFQEAGISWKKSQKQNPCQDLELVDEKKEINNRLEKYREEIESRK
ncbi:MAG: helix-turn-helix domain-containing protein [Microcoleaceae cyanobacterium]